MRCQPSSKLLGALLAVLVCMPSSAVLAQGVCSPPVDGDVADVYYEPDAVYWQPLVEYDRLVLRVDAPCDTIEKIFKRGEQPSFDLHQVLGPLDGSYRWELRVEPVVDLEVREALRASREAGDDSILLKLQDEGLLPKGPFVEGEAFSVVNGRIVPPKLDEKKPRLESRSSTVGSAGLAVPGSVSAVEDGVLSGDNRLLPKDVLHYDDVIITGSLCVGFDCANGESFSYDTIRLKENNLRIGFNDTSTGSFPTGNWQIRANDATSGGANYLAIVDMGADGAGSNDGDMVFAVEAGAPSGALYVDDYGRVGLGTKIPYVELHIADGDTPTVRLDQDGSSGFASQRWDVAGNETNFFVRDVTSGSTLPFRIRPGAPSSSIFIDTDGDVGFSDSSPDDFLDVDISGSNGGLTIESSADGTLPQLTLIEPTRTWRFRVANNGNFVFTDATSGNAPVQLVGAADSGLLVIGGTTTMAPDANRVTVNGELYIGTSMVTPDYVFEPGYPLESIEEHAESMWRDRHLPAVAGAEVSGDQHQINVGAQQFGILEELEKAHVYIEQLHGTVRGLERRLAEKDAKLIDLERRLAHLEAANTP